MKQFFIAFLIFVTTLTPVPYCQGEEQALYFTSAGGRGYTEARRAPSTAAALALTVVGIAIIVAVGLYKQGHAHSH